MFDDSTNERFKIEKPPVKMSAPVGPEAEEHAPLIRQQQPHEAEARKKPKYTFSEILVGFFAAVSAWGALDCVVEILAGGSKPIMAYIYGGGFILALLIQSVNRLLKRKFDLAHALNFFAT